MWDDATTGDHAEEEHVTIIEESEEEEESTPSQEATMNGDNKAATSATVPVSPPQVSATFKSPPYLPSSVSTWFLIVEGQFRLAKISTNETKFLHLLTSVPGEILARLPEKVLTGNNYEELKEAILSTEEHSKAELFNTLSAKEFTGGRPSAFLAEIMGIATKVEVGEDLVRHRFISSMPEAIRSICAGQTELNLVALGKLADDVASYTNTFNVAAIQDNKRQSQFDRARSDRRSESATLPKGLQPFKPDQKPLVCRAHLYYGEKANSCRRWCRWPSKDGCRVQSRETTPVREYAQRDDPQSSSPSESRPKN